MRPLRVALVFMLMWALNLGSANWASVLVIDAGSVGGGVGAGVRATTACRVAAGGDAAGRRGTNTGSNATTDAACVDHEDAGPIRGSQIQRPHQHKHQGDSERTHNLHESG